MGSKSELKKLSLVDLLKLLSPGTALRTALNDIRKSRSGALIVIDKKGLSDIVDGGFRVNCKFSHQRLVELAKMDGAIILSNDLKKILYANTLLIPNLRIKTKETGTRHMAAERTAKHIETLVIAVSQRKAKITLYYGDINYELELSLNVRRKVMETLQILEKQREMFDESIVNLNILEVNNFVTMSDVCGVLQRIEIIKRISDKMRRYLIEFGKEGIIVSMRLRELVKNLNWEREMILKDYFDEPFKADKLLESMSFDFLLETSNLSKTLFEELHDRPISSKGERILSKTNLLEKDIISLMNDFGTLDNIFNADRNALIKILVSKSIVDSLIEDLGNLKEKIRAGKRV